MDAPVCPDHYTIPSTDLLRSSDFLTKVVGLSPNPTDSSRFSAADGFEVHVVPVGQISTGGPGPQWMIGGLSQFAESFASNATHLSFRVDSLPDVVTRALAFGGNAPFSLEPTCLASTITSANQPLTFGSRSVYVKDHDQNLFEFVQPGISLEMANLK